MKKICFALAIAVVAFGAIASHQYAPTLLNDIHSLGMLSPFFFLLLYCIASIFFIPTMALTLAGGALFGPVAGTLLSLLGATLGAACAFCISRYFMFDWFATKKSIRLKNLISGVERQGWQFVALLRLMPVVPFSLVNYGLGITGIKFSHYLLATTVFLIPAEIIFTYCGYIGMDLLTHPQDFYKGTSLIVLLFMILLFIVYRRLKRQAPHFPSSH